MNFWEQSSTFVKIIIVVVLIFVAVAVIAASVSLFQLITGGGAPTTSEGSTVIVKGVVIVIPTAKPGVPAVIATTDVNIRSGPGTQYNVIGALLKGYRAEVVGVNSEGSWWAIKIPGTAVETGWVSAQYVNAENTDKVPVLQPPAVPTPTMTPPVVITDWQGEYFNNPDVAGAPALVRNDTTINFNWGTQSPAQGVPSDNYSVRWSRRAPFEEGNFRFNVNIEGGIRLWLDGRLLIDSWVSEGLRSLQADSGVIGAGDHDLRIDYFKRTGNGQISVSWGKAAGPPNAVVTGITQAQTGQLVNFSAKESQAAEGSQIVRNEWDFGDGSRGTGVDVNHTYNTANVYNVTLTVTDDKGLSDTAVHQIRIDEAQGPTSTPQPGDPPVARIAAPVEAQVSQSVTFDGGTSTSGSQIISYAWDFGDGQTANAVMVDHIYTSANMYNVTLTITDKEGQTNSTVHQIRIDEAQGPTSTPPPAEAPVARITAPSEAQAGQAVTFDGSSSTSGSQITSYAWDFGDGITADTVLVDHIYGSAGTYNVTLTVTDNAGEQDATSVQIAIRDAAVDTPVPPDLEGETWELSKTLKGTVITALFQNGTINGSAGCNTYTATYQTDGNALTVTLGSTSNKMCADNIMDQETEYLAALEGAKTYEIQGNQLRIVSKVSIQQVILTFIAAP